MHSLNIGWLQQLEEEIFETFFIFLNKKKEEHTRR
jgi:hypothetical protein